MVLYEILHTIYLVQLEVYYPEYTNFINPPEETVTVPKTIKINASTQLTYLFGIK